MLKYIDFIQSLSRSFIQSEELRFVSWSCPGTGGGHGSSSGNLGPVGFGRVLREEKGVRILEFYGNLQDCSTLEAELRGLLRGFELIQDQGMASVQVESDNSNAVQMINEGCCPNAPYSSLASECRTITVSTGCALKHFLREGNKVADKMAKMGAHQDDQRC